jgi:hypothetical protein
MNINTVSKQWASRPNDERYTSLEELKATVAKMRYYFLTNQFYAEENDELAALRAERDELREALKTIADPKNWRNRNGETVWNDCEGNEFIPEHAQEIARAVLAKYPTDEILKREG